MKTTKNSQNVSIAEEVEALLLEGKKPLPEDLKALHDEYNQLNAEIAEKEARKTAIKQIVGLHADMENVSMFTVNGVDALGFNFRTTTTVDRKKLQAKYPDVYEDVTSTSESSTFYSKK